MEDVEVPVMSRRIDIALLSLLTFPPRKNVGAEISPTWELICQIDPARKHTLKKKNKSIC